MAQVLLTVSGVVAPDTAERVAAGARPRADYLELARALDADILDYTAARAATGHVGRLLERAGGPDLMLAWACFKQRGRYRVIFTDGEQIGLPLAALFKGRGVGQNRPRHLMITHIISVRKKMVLLDWLGLAPYIDRFIVYSTWQERFIRERWNVPAERVAFTPFMVDGRFFAPDQATPNRTAQPQLCSAGLEARDYPTLMRAVEGLDVQTIIAAASPWSKRADTTQNATIPLNVTVRRFTQYDLRQLYADCRFVVMPLDYVNFQAGVTAILEAMAMGKAVICTRTPGQTDVIVEGETGLYVPAGNPEALRQAINYLLAHPAEAERMGQAGRRRVEQVLSIDHYVHFLGQLVQDVQTPKRLTAEVSA